MSIRVHHRPIGSGLSWHLHAWQFAWNGMGVWDPAGTATGALVSFPFPSVRDPRALPFKYRSTSSTSGQTVWEADDYVRQLTRVSAKDAWTFEYSRRVLYRDPAGGARFSPGDMLTFTVITRARFRGGQIYAWNPYVAAGPSAYFGETSRDDAAGTSTFQIRLADWMTDGFHLKLVGRDPSGNTLWEPNSSNRVWRPCDGAQLWLKSGQCDVRSQPLVLKTAPLQVLVPSNLQPVPTVILQDVVEAISFPFLPEKVTTSPDSPLFKIATYSPKIYADAAYTVSAGSGEGQPTNPQPIVRSFPANPANLTEISRFALGASAWLARFPSLATVDLSILPRTPSTFDEGLSVEVAIGNGLPYETTVATRATDGSFATKLIVAENTTSCAVLLPKSGPEPTPYAGLDIRRFFTPPTGATRFFTTEGVYGITTLGETSFAEPPPGRQALMRDVFGAALVGGGVFGANEMPQGSTLHGATVYFVVHAPHAVWATLVLAMPGAAGKLERKPFRMTLTPDSRYWWCALSTDVAKVGTPYRFVLNDNVEVMDPAARAVLDRGSFDVAFNADPNDTSTAWSLVADVEPARKVAHQQPWQTMGWQDLLIYELHAERFTALDPGTLTPLDLLVDELQPVSRLGEQGYLRALPVTAFELLPVQEFSSAISWGYDPSFYFAIDGHYGGNDALARFVDAAHQNGRAVMLDVVYNHSLDSPLMQIAPEVYSNGQYDGARMNCGHPMVLEHLRQATVVLCRTFGIDGFRFDDTQTIVASGGWSFLQAIRSSIRAAAAAEGRAWPYCVAENWATTPWDISNPSYGVMDGEWEIDEAYRILDASYDTWQSGSDHADALAQEMNNPAYWGRPFYQAVRFGESHDMVSAQNQGNQRIAARPPFGQGMQMAKALGSLTLLSNGVPMLFMGQEYGETVPFSFDASAPPLNPEVYDRPSAPVVNARVLAWFRQIMGLRNDPSQGLQGETNYQVVGTGHRTVAFTCGVGQKLFTVVTFGTANQTQDSSWLGLPAGSTFKEIFNSSWPVFAVEFEPEHTNGGYDARIISGQLLNLPYIGAIVLQKV